MTKKDDETKSENTRPNTSGTVIPENDDLTRWLNRIWARGEVPERIEVYQTFGRNRNTRGERIFFETFKVNEKLNIEQVVKLTNEILSECQHDCDSLPPTQIRNGATYQLCVIDRNTRSEPLVRRLGPLTPKRAYAIARGDEEDLDDEDGPHDAKTLQLKYMQEGMEQVRWDKRRYDGVMGEMLLLQHNTIERLQNQQERLLDRVMLFFDKMQESQDRALDRELIREKEKFKLSLYRDGIRTAQNMLPRLFAGVQSHKKEANGANGHANGANGHANGASAMGAAANEAAKAVYGPSPERTLIDNFLQGCEDEGGEALMLKLFGEYEDRDDDKVVVTKPGVFSFDQYSILQKIRAGYLPPDAVDPLMPDSGHELAITEQQIKQAVEAGVTQGIGTAMIELVGLRRAKKGDDEEFTEAEMTDDE